jgi:hypothetical protein
MRSIEHQRDALLTLEAAVDTARRDVDQRVEALREAVRERDRAAAHLANLIEWYTERAGTRAA